MTTIRTIWLLVALTVGFMVAGPLALAAEEQQAPQKAAEQAQQPQAPAEAPKPQESPQAQQPAAPEVPAAQAPAQPAQAGGQAQQPAAPEAPAAETPAQPKQGDQTLGAPPQAAGPLPAAVPCNGVPKPSEPGKPMKLNPCMGNEEAIKNGRQLFWRTGCEACHGPTGGGAMPGAPKLYDSEWKFGGDDETVFKLISGKIPNQTMPNVFGMILNDMQIWNIIAWIRTLYNDLPDLIVW